MTLEDKLALYSRLTDTPQAEEESIERTIQASMDALYQSEMEVPMSGFSFLFQQAGFIRKRWWIIQAAILTVLWYLLWSSHSSVYIQRSMGMMAPLFTVLILPEIWRNRSSASMEIEGASYFSIRKIYAARMLLFAMADLLLLSLFFLASAFTLKLSAAQIVIQFLLPMNVTCCICFQSLCSNKSGSEYSAFAGILIWTAVWMQIILRQTVYQKISAPVWAGAVLLSVFYLIYCVCRVWKTCGEYWEVNPSWN